MSIGLPKLKMDGKEFTLGQIPNMVEAGRWKRAVLQRSAEGWFVGDIWSVPTHWINVIDQTGAFGTLETEILQAHLKGSAVRKTEPEIIGEDFNLDKRLAEENIAQLKVGKGVVYTFGKTLRVRVRYDRDIHGPTDTYRLRVATQLHSYLEDAVVHYLHARAGGVSTLWAPFTRHRHGLTGLWDNFAGVIRELNKKETGKFKTTASLDLVAIHEDPSWMNGEDTARDAILNAYNPDYVEKRIRPLFKGMPVDEWITWRRESKVETVLPAEFEFPFRTAKKKAKKN